MEKIARWGAFAFGVVMMLDGIALIFTPDGLLTGRRPRTYLLFKGFEELFGHSLAQAIVVLFSLSLGLAAFYLAATWRQKRTEGK